MFESVISQSQQFMVGWGRLWQQQLERLDAASQEAARLQAEGAARTSEGATRSTPVSAATSVTP